MSFPKAIQKWRKEYGPVFKVEPFAHTEKLRQSEFSCAFNEAIPFLPESNFSHLMPIVLQFLCIQLVFWITAAGTEPLKLAAGVPGRQRVCNRRRPCPSPVSW